MKLHFFYVLFQQACLGADVENLMEDLNEIQDYWNKTRGWRLDKKEHAKSSIEMVVPFSQACQVPFYQALTSKFSYIKKNFSKLFHKTL